MTGLLKRWMPEGSDFSEELMAMTETELNEHISHTLSHSKGTLPQEESRVRRRDREGRATNRQPL
jgi:hypothetical protein